MNYVAPVGAIPLGWSLANYPPVSSAQYPYKRPSDTSSPSLVETIPGPTPHGWSLANNYPPVSQPQCLLSKQRFIQAFVGAQISLRCWDYCPPAQRQFEQPRGSLWGLVARLPSYSPASRSASLGFDHPKAPAIRSASFSSRKGNLGSLVTRLQCYCSDSEQCSHPVEPGNQATVPVCASEQPRGAGV
ncbi:hypothetical protein Bbelb_338770 [Branchiostoma belcheri]|nr:hypothetical protein Bbelb_338770 [Branchiostoma belcheri]